MGRSNLSACLHLLTYCMKSPVLPSKYSLACSLGLGAKDLDSSLCFGAVNTLMGIISGIQQEYWDCQTRDQTQHDRATAVIFLLCNCSSNSSTGIFSFYIMSGICMGISKNCWVCASTQPTALRASPGISWHMHICKKFSC